MGRPIFCADALGVVMGHVWRSGTHVLGWNAGSTHPQTVLGHHPETIVAPWGQGDPLVVAVPGQLRSGNVPEIGIEGSVVLDDVLRNRRVVLTDETPLDLGYPYITGH